MSLEYIITLTLTILGVVLAPVIYLGKQLMHRVDKLEEKLTSGPKKLIKG